MKQLTIHVMLIAIPAILILSLAASAEEKPITPDWVALTPDTIYTPDNAPAAPGAEDLPLKTKVSQYGITWTFKQPARVGAFINGDSYVVGPVTIVGVDPAPIYGADVSKDWIDQRDANTPVARRVRNGFMLNPPARPRVAYDSSVRNWFDPSLVQRLPVQMKPGDSLVSTISMPVGLRMNAQLYNVIERGKGDSSPIRIAAVLTCVDTPQPADAFRPSYCDRRGRIYLARDLKRQLLPAIPAPKSLPDIKLYIGFTQKPWLGTGFFGFEEPVENMPQYGREFGRVVGNSALLLCADLKPQVKEPLLINLVQVGIDLGGILRAGHPGWEGFGGHGSGRKLPIVFAGLLLGDEQLANVNRSFPKASFGEDEQTAYGEGWTGATVVFAGHRAIDQATGVARPRTGPFEHKHPSVWASGDNTSEGYRHTASLSWVSQALALRLMKAEKAWNHDPFLDYVDRWMYEDEAPFNEVKKRETGRSYSASWQRQGQCWEPFVVEMWTACRAAAGMAPIDGWRAPHDYSYYLNAIKMRDQQQAKPEGAARRSN